jgi:hypothetical protein
LLGFAPPLGTLDLWWNALGAVGIPVRESLGDVRGGRLVSWGEDPPRADADCRRPRDWVEAVGEPDD